MKRNKGFTLVELMVVVGIIAILLVLLFVNYARTRAAARDNVRVANIQQIRLALEEYKSQCREYPSRLELTANNGCPSGITLGDFTHEIPQNPDYAQEPVYFRDEVDISDTYNGFLYAGLSTRINGPCFEYHLGVPLESNREGDIYEIGKFLNEDYDCAGISIGDTYDRICDNSEDDFDDADDDPGFGLYDFRSTNSC